MLSRRRLVARAATGLAAAGLAATGLTATRARAAREVVIGAIYPFTGASASVGADARVAIETALAIVNAPHPDLDLPLARDAGLPGLDGAAVRVVFADHGGDPKKGGQEAERLIAQEKVCALLGTYQSAVATPVSSVAERAGIPFMSAENSSSSLHRRGLKFFFRAAAHDEMFSDAMFDFLDDLRARGERIESLGLFYEDTVFGTGSSNIQRRLAGERGYKLVADIRYRASAPTLMPEVGQLKAANPDVVMPTSYTADGILLVRTLTELGYKPRSMICQAAGFSEQALYDAVGPQVENIITRGSFSLDLASRRPQVTAVNALFRARSGKDLNDNSARAFMAALILADAIDRAKSTEGEQIRDALATTDIPGSRTIMPWSRVSFDETGQNRDADPVLLQYRNGRLVTVYPEPVAVAQAVWPMNRA